MFCDRCGANLQGSANFCPHCGRQFGAAPPMPVGNRVNGHLRNLAILWLAYSALRLLPGLVLNSFSDRGFPFGDVAPYFIHEIVRTFGGIFLVTGVVGVIAGWGLYERRSWARIDRKSTRLNSSHLGISYAVFCLKKKKKQRNCGRRPHRCFYTSTRAVTLRHR